MTLTIDITDGWGLSNEVHHELLPKKRKVMVYLLFVSQYKTFTQLYITNKTVRCSFKEIYGNFPHIYIFVREIAYTAPYSGVYAYVRSYIRRYTIS